MALFGEPRTQAEGKLRAQPKTPNPALVHYENRARGSELCRNVVTILRTRKCAPLGREESHVLLLATVEKQAVW
jgi:hypothetical protein